MTLILNSLFQVLRFLLLFMKIDEGAGRFLTTFGGGLDSGVAELAAGAGV